MVDITMDGDLDICQLLLISRAIMPYEQRSLWGEVQPNPRENYLKNAIYTWSGDFLPRRIFVVNVA